MDFNPRLSESCYAVLSSVIGTPKQLSVRRDIMNIHEMVESPLTEKGNYRLRTSGSYREGVRSTESDIDFMYWPTDHKVIWDLNQLMFYHSNMKLILMEYSTNQPGSAVLKLLTPTNNTRVSKACVNIDDIIYISSSKYREENLHFFKSDSIQHGPCASGKDHNFEYDHVHCFECDFWPSIAFPWIKRCRKKQWPNPFVLMNILKYGCHVVPVGAKDSPEEDLEWRISFNIAEHILINSLNHCQFLCYGLLKMFLKEVINIEDDENLLSSYFMKTILFWVIQENLVTLWSPDALLRCFWTCFEYLLKCVDNGELSNFFVPENNMFRGKIFGSPQKTLYERLNRLYNMGLQCLLLSPTLEPYLSLLLSDPNNVISVVDTETELDAALFREIDESDSFFTLCKDSHDCSRLLSIVKNIYKSGLNEHESPALRKYTCTILHRVSFDLNAYRNKLANKMNYHIDRLVLCILRKAASLGCVSDMLYIAIYYYITGRRNQALSYVNITQKNLQQPHIIYDGNADTEKYMKAVGGLPLKVKFHTSVAADVKVFRTGNMAVKELKLEDFFPSRPYLLVSPFVMVHVLEILCQQDNNEKRKQAMDDLYRLLDSKDKSKVPLLQRDICWEIYKIFDKIFHASQ